MLAAKATVVAEWVKGRQVGVIRVVDAKITLDDDWSGELAVFFDLVVSDPPPGAETWPLDDATGVYRLVDDKAREVDLDTFWYTRLSPESPEEYDDEDWEE